MNVRAAALTAALVVAGLVLAGGVLALRLLDAGEEVPTEPRWGLAGNYADTSYADMRQRGVDVLMVEMAWAAANPSEGVFDEEYLHGIERQVREARDSGFGVVLNYGIFLAPEWVLREPDARYVHQGGASYDAEPLPDLTFNTALRRHAEGYTDVVMRRLGDSVDLVRAGGGLVGELRYPAIARVDGRPSYWAYSRLAQQQAPDPGWRPCDPSPDGEAVRFVDWYLDALVDLQDWQVASLRREYDGPIAVLYPSEALTRAEIEAAAEDRLCGHVVADDRGRIAAGYDHAGQVAALEEPDVLLWSTSVNNPGSIDGLARLADRHERRLAGENTGQNSPDELHETVSAARRHRLDVLMWIRAPQAYCRCEGWATIEDYELAITPTRLGA